MNMEHAIKRGIALLDEQEPGWRDKVNSEKLAMGSGLLNDRGCGCLLAQIYGSFDLGCELLEVWDEPGYFGFDLGHPDEVIDYDRLTEDWQHVLAEGGA
jgi:hypothetical protein